ncbi:hypothetical protein C6Y40_11335 [Alteromonas alba]|uniref:Uncharacterized protein n=1 Tax=Alteromonas alba TaxID=2079529 RepID=A0A2S9VAL9_9ALTE|nr:hypothetical protein C6Y40_11335 [Alteromonas alba]
MHNLGFDQATFKIIIHKRTSPMNHKHFIYLIVLLSLSACSVNPFDDVGSFYSNFQVFEEKMCSGTYKLEYPIKNGRKSKSAISKKFYEKTDGIEQYYAFQASEDTCWSASLETAFRYAGLEFTQEQFRDALGSSCPDSGNRAATANQILFAASEAHASGAGLWLGKIPRRGIDIDYCDVVNILSLLPKVQSANCKIESSFHREADEFFLVRQGGDFSYSPDGFTMSSTNPKTGKLIYEKQLVIIKSLSDMLVAMDKDYPVFVAMNRKGRGHTVVLRDVTFYTSIYKENDKGGYNYTTDSNTHLEKVSFLDPTERSTPRIMTGDRFLEKVAFSFYIQT